WPRSSCTTMRSASSMTWRMLWLTRMVCRAGSESESSSKRRQGSGAARGRELRRDGTCRRAATADAASSQRRRRAPTLTAAGIDPAEVGSVTNWLVSIGTADGGTREITIEAAGEEQAIGLADDLLESGETVQGLIESPDADVDADEWAGGI